MVSILDAALHYLDCGMSVIPTNGKRAAVKWSQYQERCPRRDELVSWFGANCNKNIAVVTGGVSKLIVVDVDSASDADWWSSNYPTSPLMAISGRGGTHFYYKNPGLSVSNKTRIMGRRIDIRGQGGYIVVPPSVHPGTSMPYRWMLCHDLPELNAFDSLPLFCPSWLGDTKKSNPGVANRNTITLSSVTSIRNPIAYISKIRAISGKNGNATTFRVACKLRDSGLSEEQALAAISSWNETNAVPPWEYKELVQKIDSAYRPP